MPATIPCWPSAAVPQTVNTPGVAGNDGRNAYSTVISDFTVPNVAYQVATVYLDTVAWLLPNAVVNIGNTTQGLATFRVASINTALNTAIVSWLDGPLDVIGGVKFLAQYGTILTPAGTFAGVSAISTKSVAAPSGTTSTAAAVMMGLAASITPVYSGRVMIQITGVAANNTGADGVNLQLSYGTGAAPVNGAALAGTQIGSVKHIVAATGPGKQGFALSFPVTGLQVGTTYWIDVAVQAVTGGTAAITDVDVVAFEC